MGVPSFYKWLAQKYPKVVSEAVEEKGENLDCSLKNPNGVEFDNLYLDMNGIIHPCFHPDDDLFPPTTFDEVFSSICEYIDRLFNIVRPRKLLFMAIDGVAPRAKMNQQRTRRFRTAKDAQMAEEMEDDLRKQFEKEGRALLPKVESQVTDSNVITPGTEFMNMLSEKLQSYIRRQMREKSCWGNIKVILSDCNVPGEGEHKIMSFIRAQRSSSGYDPNTMHCLYGLDADLIMLALATHEIHFSILREEVLPPDSSFRHATPLHPSTPGAELEKFKSCSVKKNQNYQFLNVWILREYLALDMKITSLEKIEFDLERIIDDFIFICFFAGNDFLPHMPGLEIGENCIDLLMHVYKKEFQNLGGHLVDTQKVEDKKGGYIKLKRVEKFVLAVGSYEEKIFSKRSHIRERRLKQILAVYRDAKEYEKNQLDDGTSSDIVVSYATANVHEELKISALAIDENTALENTKELKKKLKDNIQNQFDLFKKSLATDKVKFGSPGFKERYYKEKFSAESQDEIEAMRKQVVMKYSEGLCWILLYYFSDVPSWTWFYPYHYSPLTSDLKGLSHTKVKFQKGSPFKPFDQLMGVLPPRSTHALPKAYRGLMIDENSSIIDFYPTEFEIDTDGKRFLWQGVSKLPFIEEGHLLMETRKLENDLEDHERVRNSETLDRLFVRCKSKESLQVVLPCRTRVPSKKIEGATVMDSTIEGIKGTLHLMPEDLTEADDNNKGENARNLICMFYEINQGFQNVPRPLEGVKIPEKTVVDKEEIGETILWHENQRNSSLSSNANRYQNQRLIKPEHKSRYSSENPPAFIPKVAGRGFSLGRGRTSYSPTVTGQHTSYQGYHTTGHQPYVNNSEYNWAPKAGFSRWDEYGRNEGLRKPALLNDKPQQVGSNVWQGRGDSEYNQGPRTGFSRRDEYRGNAGLRKPASYSNQRYMLNDKPQQVGSNVWQGRGDVTRDTSEDWRANGPMRAAPVGSWQKKYVDSFGQAQHLNTGPGHGHGRGWIPSKTDTEN